MSKRLRDLVKDEEFDYLKHTGNSKMEELYGKMLTLYEFLCSGCGELFWCRKDTVLSGKQKSCGCQCTTKDWKAKLKQYGEDYKYYVMWAAIKERAKQRGKEYFLTVEDVKYLYLKQNGKCAYTFKDIRVPETFTGLYDSDIVSIDRIDSNLPYTLENSQLVTKAVNFMKSDLTHDNFISVCKNIYDIHGAKNDEAC